MPTVRVYNRAPSSSRCLWWYLDTILSPGDSLPVLGPLPLLLQALNWRQTKLEHIDCPCLDCSPPDRRLRPMPVSSGTAHSKLKSGGGQCSWSLAVARPLSGPPAPSFQVPILPRPSFFLQNQVAVGHGALEHSCPLTGTSATHGVAPRF